MPQKARETQGTSGLSPGLHLDGEEAADVLPQQLGKTFVEVGADGDVTLVALVGGGELIDHRRAIFQPVALELHGARLQSAIGGDHPKTLSGLAAGCAAVGEVLAGGRERAGGGGKTIWGIAAQVPTGAR